MWRGKYQFEHKWLCLQNKRSFQLATKPVINYRKAKWPSLNEKSSRLWLTEHTLPWAWRENFLHFWDSGHLCSRAYHMYPVYSHSNIGRDPSRERHTAVPLLHGISKHQVRLRKPLEIRQDKLQLLSITCLVVEELKTVTPKFIRNLC